MRFMNMKYLEVTLENATLADFIFNKICELKVRKILDTISKPKARPKT